MCTISAYGCMLKELRLTRAILQAVLYSLNMVNYSSSTFVLTVLMDMQARACETKKSRKSEGG